MLVSRDDFSQNRETFPQSGNLIGVALQRSAADQIGSAAFERALV
jgi:hypothetical protein